MPTLLIKSWRDLGARRWHAVGLTLLVATMVTATAGASRAGHMLDHTRESTGRDLALADVEIHCSPTLPGVLERVHDVPGLVDAEEVLVRAGMLHGEGFPQIPALVRVLPDEPPSINRIEMLAGRYPAAGEEGVILDRSLRTVFGLDVGDTVELEVHGVRRRLPVLGISLSPDHILFPCHPEFLIPVPATLGSLSVSRAAAAPIPYSDLVNVLRFRLTEGSDKQAIKEQLLDQLGVSPIAVFTSDEAPDRLSAMMILRFFDIYLPAGVLVLIVVAFTLLVLTLHRIVRSELTQIGVLAATGTRPGAIAAGYVLMPVVAGLIGAVLGSFAHTWYAHLIFDSYARGVGYAPLRDPGTGSELWITAAACLIIGAAVAFVLAYATAAKRPLQLLRPSPRHTRRFHVVADVYASLRRLLRLPLSVVLGLTYLSRRPWVTIATIGCLAANLGLVMAFLFVHVTHVEETERNMDRHGREATIGFTDPVPDETLSQLAADVEGVVEPMISTTLLAEFPDGRKLHRALCLQPEGWLRELPILRGRALRESSANEILIDQWLSDTHGVDVGATIECFPWYSAPESSTFEIVGVIIGPSHGMLILPLEAGRELLRLPGLSTSASIGSSLPTAALEQKLWAAPGVESVQSLTRARQRVGETFAGLERVLAVAVIMSVVVAVLFLGLLAALDAADRAPDLAVLRAVGWRDRSMLVLCITEVVTRGGLAFLVSIPLAPMISLWLLEQLRVANRYRLDLVAPPWAVLAVGAACLVLMPLGAIPAWRAARRVGAGAAVRMLARE